MMKDNAMNAKRIKKLVDELGTVRASLATLKDSEAEIRTLLIDAGVDVAEGELFRATISRSTRELVDWQKIAKRLKASRQLVNAHTTKTPITIVRTSTRRGGAHA
jgi:type II secretory pathway component PulM